MANPYRLLPSVEDVLSSEAGVELAGSVRRELLGEFVADVLDRWRAAIKAGELDADGVRERLERGDLERSVRARADRERKAGLVRVVNAAGVVLHTGLGRAPVHPDAAEAMKISAQDLLKFGVIDAIIDEPVGGAHRDPARTIERLGDAVESSIQQFEGMTPEELKQQRRRKFLAIGRTGLA